MMSSQLSEAVAVARARTFSDSLDDHEDDELAELHERRQSLEVGGTGGTNGRREEREGEDTDYASEQDEDTLFDKQVEGQSQNIKEQVYFDKLRLLKATLADLEAGNHKDFRKVVTKLDKEYEQRSLINETCKEREVNEINAEYNSERLLAAREFESKKIELRETLIKELEEQKKQIEQERYTLDINADAVETNKPPPSKRKLRSRGNDSSLNNSDKRRKTPQTHLAYMLDQKLIEEDLKVLPKGIFKENATAKPAKTDINKSSDDESPESSPVQVNARIEGGKLFYEKRWYHRGQSVYVEGKELKRTSGNIIAISQNLVCVRKLNEQGKIKVPISALQDGKLVIKRRA